jgi:hypothetical protein
MLGQSRRPDEIVINDNNSTDATAAIVERAIAIGRPIRLVRGGHNIPSGRNNAIRHARGDIIACTDAGLTLDPEWLATIVAPIERGEADLVGGFFRPAPRSLFELALAATNYPDVEEIDPATFLPFGQSVAFRRSMWEQVGGYPEWASHCEDLLFDLALKRRRARVAFAPTALVHFRPRESFGALWHQYFAYARGDGAADLWRKRHAIRYATYLGGLALGVAALRRPWIVGLGVLGAIVYCAAPVRRLLRRAPGISTEEKLHALALIPLLRAVGDLAKMAGYPAGVVRRLRDPQLREAAQHYGQVPSETSSPGQNSTFS